MNVAGPGVKRAPRGRVCESCRRRKVRCDIMEQNPCSNCVLSTIPCVLKPPSRTRANSQPGTAAKVQTTSPSVGVTAAAASSVGRNFTVQVQEAQAQVQPARENSLAILVDHPNAHFPQPLPTNLELFSSRSETDGSEQQQQQQQPQNATLAHDRGSPDSSIITANRSSRPILSNDDDIWTHNLPRHNSAETLDNINLAAQSAISPGSTSTHSTNGPAKKRVKFGGEMFSHSILPVMDGHTELSASVQSREHPQVNHQDLRHFSAPTSERPRGKAPWIHADCRDHMNMLGHLPREDQYYLYTMKKVFSFPQYSVTKEMLRTFFISLYPLFPILDRRHVVRSLDALYNHQQSSPLLFHSILFCASRFVDEKILHDAGFASRAEAKEYFYSRAKILYFYDCERDQTTIVQSTILLSFWWIDFTEEKDMRYWTVCAVNLALGMGMHRTVPKSLSFSISNRNLWRRIFWTLFIRDHNVAIAIGQPFALLHSNCDLLPLCDSDFDEEDVTDDVMSFVLPKQELCHIHTVIKQADLTIRLEQLVLTLQNNLDHEAILKTLAGMSDIASKEIISSPFINADGFSIDDASTWTEGNMCAVFLHLNHERFITLYHRKRERALADQLRIASLGTGGNPPVNTSNATAGVDEARDVLVQTRKDILASATRVVQVLYELNKRDLIRHLPSFVNTTNFHAFLTLVERLIRNPTGTRQHENAKHLLATGLDAQKEMRKYWSAASWTYSLYSELATNDYRSLKLIDRGPQSRYSSRLPSRFGSPSLNPADQDPAWELEFLLEPLQYLSEGAPYSIDLFNNWEIGPFLS